MDDISNINALLTDEQINFCNFPLWNLPVVHYPSVEDLLLESSSSQSLSIPHQQDPFQGNLNGLDELSKIFEEGYEFWNDKDHDKVHKIDKSAEKIQKEKQIEYQRNITFEEVSKYFYMPITQAARELNIGLTLLKKKCRELGIPRWPHRKMKSLQTLIRNVQELGGGEEDQVRTAMEMLEEEKRLMERIPALQMEEKTKRLRQACFKANYKKRRLMAMSTMLPSSSTSSSSSTSLSNFDF